MLNHAGLLPPLFDLPNMGILIGIISKLVGGGALKSTSTPVPLFSPRALSHGIRTRSSLKRSEAALLKSRTGNSSICVASSPQDPELQHPVITAAKAPLSPHTPNKLSLVFKYEMQQSTSHCWLCDHLF